MSDIVVRIEVTITRPNGDVFSIGDDQRQHTGDNPEFYAGDVGRLGETLGAKIRDAITGRFGDVEARTTL